MVHNQGIEVYLTPFTDMTKRYKEYPVPATSPSFSYDSNEVYIEAVDGERFMIFVDFGGDFSAKTSTHLKIRYTVDGSSGATNTTVPTESKLESHSVFARRINGHWVKSGYTFVPLQIGTLCIFLLP
jgi:hypothetical protein